MSEDQKPPEPKDKVVIVNGERQPGIMTQTEANAEVKRRQQIAESQGNKVNVEVKQNICG